MLSTGPYLHPETSQGTPMRASSDIASESHTHPDLTLTNTAPEQSPILQDALSKVKINKDSMAREFLGLQGPPLLNE